MIQMARQMNETFLEDEYNKFNLTPTAFTENSSDYVYKRNSDIVSALRAATNLMLKSVPPALLLLGTFGNIMIMLLFRKKSTTSLSVFFRALAVSDLCLLYTGMFPEWIESVSGFSLTAKHDALCKLITVSYYIFGVLSAWLVVAMTAQRAACVIWPHKVNILCTRKKSIMYICVITVLICGLNSHILVGARLIPYTNGTVFFCSPDYSLSGYYVFLKKIWPFIDTMIFSIVPFAILIISNIVLIWKVSDSVRKARITFASSQSDQLNSRTKTVSSMTVTLIAVSVAFLLLTAPSSLYFILQPYVTQHDEFDELDTAIVDFSFFFINFLWYSNSAVNFYLYCLTGSKFRNEAKELFCCGQKQTLTTSLNTQISQSEVGSNANETEF